MRLITILFLILLCACKNQVNKPLRESAGIIVRHLDSFELNGKMVFLKEFTTTQRDSFHIICYDSDQTYLTLASEIPSGSIKLQNITGDSLPEIILDDCFACEFEGLRFFSFQQKQQRFIELKGTDGLCSEFYKLDGTPLFYDSFYHNRGGCTSTLFELREDSCIQLAKLEVPYSNKPITLITSSGQPMEEKLKARPDVDMDTVVRQVWMEKLGRQYQVSNR